MAAICLGILLFAGVLLNQVLTSQARYLIDARSRALMEMIISVRDYTAETVTPIVDPINNENNVFNPAAVPGYAAQKVFGLFKKRDASDGESYREAALNPTNPQDLADSFEADLIRRFRSDPELQQISGDRVVHKESVHYIARPIRVDSQACLRCHSTPNNAPASQLARYGSKGGFGWEMNEIVGAQVLSVSQTDVFDLRNQSLAITAVLFAASFAVLIVIVNIVLNRQILAPIADVALGLRQLRSGTFDLHLSNQREDEMGRLMNDLDHTAMRLGLLMESEKQLTAKTLQLDTARAIHRCFLVKHLPQSKDYSIAADSQPALEIGADWYDAFVVGDLTFVLVADVCDKGVGSALFMSVFRSLIHFSLQSADIDDEEGIAQALSDVMTRVNDYMAKNHEDVAMFATIFIGAYHCRSQHLTFINAGHELPVLLGPESLKRLPVTGPAVGVFAGSAFKALTITLSPGSILFAYSDGLTDARSPSGEAWGWERLQESLSSHYSSNLSAPELIMKVEGDVAKHVAGADAFDDLTMLSMKINRMASSNRPS